MIRPLNLEENYKLAEGIIASDKYKDWVPPQQGEVIAVGSEARKVKVGETVCYGLGSGKKFLLDEEVILILLEEDIIGKVSIH